MHSHTSWNALLIWRRAAVAILWLSAGTAASLLADTPADVVIRGVAVVDVRRGEVMPGRDIVIRGTHIASVALSGQVLPHAKTAIDGRGKFASPGLIDAEVTLARMSRGTAAALLADGITAVRDVGTSPDRIAEWRRELAHGKIYSPRIARACPTATAAPTAESGCGPPSVYSAVLAALLDARAQRLAGSAGVARLGLHEELELRVRAGFTSVAALRAVTIESAQMLLAADLGEVAAGMAADLVVTTANPLADIRNLRLIDAVVFRGEALTPAHLNLLRSRPASADGVSFQRNW